MTEDCSHEDVEFTSTVERTPSADGQFLVAYARIRCSACHTLFSWRGLPTGVPNAHEPVTSADGFELRCPVQPGPGGSVGVLAAVGMTDRLVENK